MAEAVQKQEVSCCPVQVSLSLIGGKWKVIILYYLFGENIRFGELKKMTNGITQKMLTQQLRELESDGLVRRKIYAEVPPRVEYSLTELGETLRPVLDSVCQWGRAYMSKSSNQ